MENEINQTKKTSHRQFFKGGLALGQHKPGEISPRADWQKLLVFTFVFAFLILTLHLYLFFWLETSPEDKAISLTNQSLPLEVAEVERVTRYLDERERTLRHYLENRSSFTDPSF